VLNEVKRCGNKVLRKKELFGQGKFKQTKLLQTGKLEWVSAGLQVWGEGYNMVNVLIEGKASN
jgi:hypothetical protein